MVTLELFQPAALGGGLLVPVMPGGVLSIDMLAAALLRTFPATSTTWPEINWFAPSALTVTGTGKVATPEVASVHVKLTVTLELFQPLSFAAGVTMRAIRGKS